MRYTQGLLSIGIIGALTFFSFSIAIQDTHASATVPSGFSDSTYVSGLLQPVAFAFTPDNRIFVTEKGGSVRIIKNDILLATPFLHLSVDTYKERGLLGIAVDPDFLNNKFIYVYYTLASTSQSRVSRFTTSASQPDTADPSSEVILLDDIPSQTGNHNGGAVHFGHDGKLYIAVGDNNVSTTAQDLSTLAGKLLRINKDGSVPNDNPFVGRAGARNEIYSFGLRNPFTFAVDPLTGTILINDVGENSFEEIDEVAPGRNFGWPQCEGFCSSTSTNPLYVYDHSVGHSIAGGVFNESTQFPSSYSGAYFYADYVNNFIKKFDVSTNSSSDFASDVPGPVDLSIGPDGSLYYLSITKGLIGKIQYGQGLLASYFPSIDFTGTPVVRTDPQINFDWGDGAPMSNFPSDNFSVRWQGRIVPQYSENYTLYARSDDGVRVWVNNALIIDRFMDQAATESVGNIQLTAGQKYDIKVEYYERGGQAVAQLSWSSASRAKEIIPQTRLFQSATPSTSEPLPTPMPPPSPTPSPSPTPVPTGGSTITVYAAGEPAQGVYPELQLVVDDVPVTTFSNITGDAQNRLFQTFSYTSSKQLRIGQIKLNYTNDVYVSPGQDRNVRVDKVVLDGVTYEVEAPSTYSTGTWDGSCNAGFKKSEWLHCGGYFSFAGTQSTSPAPTPTPVPTPQPSPTTPAQPSTLTFFAAGEQAQGVYPTLQLMINGSVVKTFEDIRGDANGRVFGTYSYTQSTPIDIWSVTLQYSNDLYIGPGQDRNVRVDKVMVDGTTYETESPQTYSTGTWDGSCNAGFKKSEWLHCGGYFRFK